MGRDVHVNEGPMVPVLPPERRYDRWDAAWRPGDGEPLIADAKHPAVAQAIGRCYTVRMLKGSSITSAINPGAAHPKPCNWCDYPTDALKQALGYARFHAKLNLVTGEYDNPEWARFFAGATWSTRAAMTFEEIRKAGRRRFLAVEEQMYGQATLAQHMGD